MLLVVLIVCKMSSVLSLLHDHCENINHIYVSVPSLNVNFVCYGSLFQILHDCFSKKTGQRRAKWYARDLYVIIVLKRKFSVRPQVKEVKYVVFV